MLVGRELLKRFKAITNMNPEGAAEFIMMVEEVRTQDLIKMLEILCNKKFTRSLRDHQIRCGIFAQLAKRSGDRALFVPFVRAIKVADSRLRAVLLDLLPRVNNAEGHGELVSMLRSQDQQHRKIAVQTLSQLGGRAVRGQLDRMLQEPNFDGIEETIEVLFQISGPHAVSSLNAILTKGKPQLKIYVLRYLSNRKLMEKSLQMASRSIERLFSDPSEKVVQHAISGYAQIATEDQYIDKMGIFFQSSKLSLARAALRGLKHFRSPAVLGLLERKLRAGPERTSLMVLEVLEEIGDEGILGVLVAALGHRSISLRSRAQQILTRLGQAQKIDLTRAVIWLLRSRDVNVRRTAVELAKSVPDPVGDFWPKMLAFLHDEDWWVRERIIDALMEMAGRKLTRYIVAYLQDASDVIRRFAVDVLIRLNDPNAIGALVRSAQTDPDWWVREKAIEALGVLGRQDVIPYILEIMHKEVDLQWSCVQALETLNARSTAPYIANLLNSPSTDIQLSALQCLAHFQAIDQAPAVMKLLQSQDPEIRLEAQNLLRNWEIRMAHGIDAYGGANLSPLDRILMAARQIEGQDLILAPNKKIFVKRMGQIVPLSEQILSDEEIRALLMPHLTVAQLEQLEKLEDIDLSYEIKDKGMRFRANIFQQFGGLSAVFRVIEGKLANFESLGLPPIVRQFGDLKNGLVVVGGPTGSGKSTTLAALMDYINRTSERHIISMEDPIEVVHNSQRSLVNQREIGTHTRSFENALRSTLRQDPDVILIGEMRDLATISFGITVAETGHLVFGTLHTVSADTTVDRLLGVFPPGQREQIRSMLSQNLRAVVCQYLLKRKDAPGRIMASEVMINNEAISNLIRKGKQYQIPSIVATSREQGMQQMDQDLMRLYQAGRVSASEVYMKARNKKDFEDLMQQEQEEAARGQGVILGRIEH